MSIDEQFQIEEFKSLRTEIGELVKETRNLEIYAAGALVAYYAWILTHCINSIEFPITQQSNLALHWLVPIALPLLGGWRSWSNYGRISEIARYVREVEDRFDASGKPIGPEKGWEHYLSRLRRERVLSRGSHVAIWLLLIGLTIAVPFFVGRSDTTCKQVQAPITKPGEITS